MNDTTPVPDILIRGARLIDPDSGIDQIVDVAVSDGLVQTINPAINPSGFDRVIDAEGMILSPGLIDPHVHLREPGQTHKEDIESGTKAAAAGGFTTVCCMPNTSPALDSPEMVEFVRSRAEQVGHCRVFSVAAATKDRKGQRLAEIGLCLDAGAVAYSDDGDVIESASMMKAVLQTVKETGKCFMQHCQELTLASGAVMHAGTAAAKLGHKGWPREAEEIIIERDLRLNKSIGCHYHIQHMSSGNSVQIVARAQREGIPVTAEASPHHLLLTHEAIETHGTMAKMNPPLREQSDIDALKQGIADGVITILATDHAPHTNDEKRDTMGGAPFGIIGLESALGLYHKALVETGVIDWPKLIELLTINPAKLCGLDSIGLGSIAIGGPADLTLIDPDCQWTLESTDLVGKSQNTPFLGWTMGARAVMSIVGGQIRHQQAERAISSVD
jgi:dihydroorotase